ncbi:MAG: hypothetical protein IT371_23715 [Deltaproteobacteria bacterium]|nr:hypothetical protein [Deltaproteobacteria bacterium]
MPASIEEAVFRARMAYVTDPGRRSLEHWYAQHAEQVIGWSSFRRRASLGHWTEEREQFWTQVSTTVVKERAGALAATQLQELADLEKVRQTLHGELAKLEVKPRSLEGLVAALVSLDRRADEKRRAILDRLRPAESKEPEAREHQREFTPEETRVVARALLQFRFEEQQKRLAQGRTDG